MLADTPYPSIHRFSRWPTRFSCAVFVASVLSFSLSGCPSEDAFEKLPDPELRVDELQQRPTALIDILWVVDNSGTMIEEQASLAKNFDAFIRAFTQCQNTGVENDTCDFATKTCSLSGGACNPPDYHVGVISTDTRSTLDSGQLRRVGLCTPSAGAPPANGKYRYCLGNDADCLEAPDVPSSDPTNNRCDMSQSIAFVTPTTPNGGGAFERAIRVGTSGSGNEQGLRAAAMALGVDTKAKQNGNLDSTLCAGVPEGNFCQPPSANEGFLRPDAALFIIFVSDEDDGSFGEVPYFYRAFGGLKGAGNDGRVSISAIVGDPDPDGEGEAQGGCPAEAAHPNAEAGTRYIALAMYSRGLSGDLHACDTDKRLVCPDGTKCEAPVGGLLGFCVPTTACSVATDCSPLECEGAPCLTCQETACTLERPQFSGLLAEQGIFLSICAEDYAVVLDALGVNAAGLTRKFKLTRPVDCTQSVPCCATTTATEQSVNTVCDITAPVCVRVDGQPVANRRTDGWIYDRAANAIFFGGNVGPAANAQVSVSYHVPTSSSQSIGCDQALE